MSIITPPDTHCIPITLEQANRLYKAQGSSSFKGSTPTVFVISTNYHSAFALGRPPTNWNNPNSETSYFFTSRKLVNNIP